MCTAAEVLTETLKKSGVKFVFGIPSIHNIPVYDALYKEPAIRHIQCRQETTACHMADGFARAMWCGNQTDGVPGVILASTGPGTGYLVPAVHEAFGSSSPLLIITTNVPAATIGQNTGALHEFVDQDAVFKNITKRTVCVKSADEIETDTVSALESAISGRPGPVYLEIPTDILSSPSRVESKRPAVSPGENRVMNDIDNAVTLLEKAKKPLIIAGNAALRAGLSKEIRTLAKALYSPVITTSQSKGIIEENSVLSFGNAAQKGIIQEIAGSSDLAIAIGTRLREADGKRRGLNLPKLIHIDWDDTWLNRNFPADIALTGDIRSILSEITGKIKPYQIEDKKIWVDQLNKQKEETLKQVNTTNAEMQYVNAIRDAMPRDGVLITDNTQLGYWCEFFYPSYRPGGIIAAKGSSPIGFAFPAAVGAKIARPKDKVVALIGDGGFLYCAQELATCVRYNIGFPLIVVNDNAFGVIRYLQKKAYNRDFESDLTNPDFIALAKSFGIEGVRVTDPSQLHESLQKALLSEKMCLIEVQTVFPEPAFARY
jgi:acetolactate synthase I/II/III large subunit